MGFSREVAVGIKIFISLLCLFAFIMEWRKRRRIIKFGGCYEATVTGFKGTISPYPIVQFTANGKMIEEKVSCGTYRNPPLGATIKVYYWEEYYDEIISEDPDLNYRFAFMLLVGSIVFFLWIIA